MTPQMIYVRLEVGFPWHRKVLPLSDKAFRLHITALCHCRAYLTDGHVDRALIKAWSCSVKQTMALERAGLWEPTPSGWLIHDYTDYNPVREEIEDVSAKRAAAGSLGGRAKAKGAQTTPKQDAKQRASKPLANPQANREEESREDQRRVEERFASARDPLWRDKFLTLLTAFGANPTRQVEDEFAQISTEHSIDDITKAIAAARRSGRRLYPSRIWPHLPGYTPEQPSRNGNRPSNESTPSRVLDPKQLGAFQENNP